MNDVAFRRVEFVKVLSSSDGPMSTDKLGVRFGVNRRTIESDFLHILEKL